MTETIGNKIRKYRKERNMSQEELSNLSGINISTIKKYESGYRNPKPDQLLKISSALGISINSLIEFEIQTVSDVISLLMRMDEQTNMKWTGKKDADGNYIPSSITISFDDEKLNKALSSYMQYRDMKNFVSDNNLSKTPALLADCSFEQTEIMLENQKNRLVLFNEKLHKDK